MAGAGWFIEDAAIDEVALTLLGAAALTGESPEDLVARLSDADLASLYRNCSHEMCATCHTSRARPPFAVGVGVGVGVRKARISSTAFVEARARTSATARPGRWRVDPPRWPSVLRPRIGWAGRPGGGPVPDRW